MAQINLSAGESFTVVGGTNTFSGSTTSGETVVISGGVNSFTADFNAGGDRIVLAGSVGQYSVQRSGSSIILRGPNGTVVTLPAPNPNLADTMNPVISFTTGNVRDFVLDSTTAGVITLGGTVIGATTPVVIANSDPIIVNVTATDLVAALGTGNVVFTFTLAQAQARAVTLDVAAIGGTAIPGVNVTAPPSTVTFAPYQTAQSLTLPAAASLEAIDTIVLQVSPNDGAVLSPDADLIATIRSGMIVDYFALPLRVGPDNYADGLSFFGVLSAGQTGKLLAAEDRIVGFGGSSLIRLVDTNGQSTIDDVDFTGVTNVGQLQTNFSTIRFGAQVDRAGIIALETRLFADNRNFGAGGVVQGGTLVDLTADADGNGIADFDNPLRAVLPNSAADTVRFTLQSASPATIDTGMTFQPAIGGAVGPIDNIVISSQTNPVRLTFNIADVGNGTPYAAGTQILSVRAQATDAVGVLIGGGARFDDEGIRFTGATFVIDNGASLSGGYGEVILGTGLADTLTATTAAPAYIVGGLGEDRITGGAGADTLIGGGGKDVFVYTAANQSRGASYDTIVDFAYGTDTIDLPGGTRSVSRIAAGPLNAASLDSDLTALIGSSLAAGGAVLVTAVAGTLSGATFLIADGNGVAGYQAGEDLVIRLPDPPTVVPGVLVV